MRQGSALSLIHISKKAPEVFISEADEYLFAQGTHYDIYKKLGAHPSVENGKKGMFLPLGQFFLAMLIQIGGLGVTAIGAGIIIAIYWIIY